MRVLIATTSGVGHIHPVVPLAKALVAADHEVLWATGPQACEVVARSGFDTTAAGLDGDQRITQFFERHADVMAIDPRRRRPPMFAGMFADVAAPTMAAELGPVMDRFDPDVVVHEVAELASAPLAEARGIRHVAVAFSGALPRPVVDVLRGTIAPVWNAVGLDVPDDVGLTTHAYLHPFPPSLGQRPDGPTVHPMRPLHEDGRSYLAAPDWSGSLGRDRPLVYATYGTEVAAVAPWGEILGALAMLDVDAVVTVGRQVDRNALAALVPGPARHRVRVESYVPQSLLLGRAAAVISHAGAGTMLGAAAAGVPHVCLPIAADQFDNAAALIEAGAGRQLLPGDGGADAIAAAVRDVLDDPQFAESSRRLATELAEMPPPEQLVAVCAGSA